MSSVAFVVGVMVMVTCSVKACFTNVLIWRERERVRSHFWLKLLWAIHGGLSQDGISSGSSSWVLEPSALSLWRTVLEAGLRFPS